MSDVRKLLKKIQSNRVDLLTETADLTSKLVAASNIVNTALAGVKTKADQDMTQVEGIVNSNKQALSKYLTEKGSDWTGQLQSTIAKAAQQVSKALSDMSSSLTSQFTDSKKKAEADLVAVDTAVDAAVQTAGRSMSSAKKRFDLAIKNATQVTDSILSDLSAPITDMRDQITAATNVLSATQSQVTLGVSAISNNASTVTQSMINNIQAATKNMATNPAFANLTATAGAVSAQATADMRAAETTANARVATLESQLGNNDQNLGSISAALEQTIDAQKKDFDTQTKVQAGAIQSQVGQTSSQLQAMANENAAMVDDAKANADDQLAAATGRVINSIQQSHDQSQSSIQSVNDRINQSASQAATLIQSSFGGIIADSQSVLQGASSLADAADITTNKVSNLSASLDEQNKLVNSNIASATSQLGMLRDLGSSAVDNFSNAASAATASAVGSFSKSADSVVGDFASTMQGKMDSLTAAQAQLESAQSAVAQQATMTQAALQSNLTMAQNLLNSLQANSTLTDASVKSVVAAMLTDFKQGSLAEVSNLKASTSAQLQQVANDLKNSVASAGDEVNAKTRGFVDSLVSLSQFVSDHSKDLSDSVGETSGAVGDFKTLVDHLVGQLSSMSDDLKLYYQNTSNFVNNKLGDTEQLLNDSRDDALEKIQDTWDQLRTAMENVDGSTAQKVSQFQRAVNESIQQSDQTVQNFTSYLDNMIQYEKRTAASRLAIQRGILQSIIANAANSNTTGSAAASAEMIARLKAVMGTAGGAVNASSDELAAQKAAQDALINSFGFDMANKVNDLLSKLQGNSDAFVDNINSSSSASASDSQAMLRAAGLGVQGVVGLANNIADSVGIALDDTQRQYRDSQVAMAALSAETNGLSNITEAQLTAVIQAMMNSQNMFSGELDSAKKNNSESIALISGVIKDFVVLVNQTLAESNDLIATVDANYTNASMVLGSKMDTILGFISREASKISESADWSSRALKELLTRNGAMEEGIQSRLGQLSSQQDSFAHSVHDQLQGFISRLNDDSSKLSTARQAATNKLYDALHNANTQFAANAAEWQSERLASSPSSLVQVRIHQMSDEELVKDVERHLRATHQHKG
ncbi:hypothetical protein C9890_0032 [Perkinsus sp. BL_2016]|nr:hypothetical protein C9890_0032 [Perkinsus sp. BL_2016]